METKTDLILWNSKSNAVHVNMVEFVVRKWKSLGKAVNPRSEIF